ncbi:MULTISPECIES: TRAP transporter small permease subunit [Alphaproteobacteria]|uniref:TRAP transporter small permease protein n=2 Tax=Alphaproteobacteria TaxID=28211 RepID=A0A512HKR5_9HYPH|nr:MULTISPECIES: TRAP transporter small permease subunit [Alphaproteobacteria]GEO86021.1 C4-dicarboxylate ABC transporter [Ciceribacter naphthalenivorans]GLR22108.1 C4-dicarboxylate ABC transporter [Ciceribacter naphthalenivorans]GLT04964.1 C4-dicarboxylate ABC transporter [Sphingomonas psychrolutea]
MKMLLAITRVIDTINGAIGRWVSWLLLAAVLISAGNAVVRKTFDISSNAWLELQWYLYGTVFMLAAAYALLKNEHIRIDILSSSWSKKTRDWIDLILHIIFLVPFTFLMTWLAWPWFWNSFKIGEISSSAGGLTIWPAKAAIFFGFLLLSAQAISEIIKRAAIIFGQLEDPAHEKDAAEVTGH